MNGSVNTSLAITMDLDILRAVVGRVFIIWITYSG